MIYYYDLLLLCLDKKYKKLENESVTLLRRLLLAILGFTMNRFFMLKTQVIGEHHTE